MAHHGSRAVLLLHLMIVHLAVVVCSHLHSPATAFTSNQTVSVPSVPCLPDQASALLRLKRSFITTNYSAIAFRSWRAGTDCCHWEGIHCDEADGRVTSLDLGDCGLESGRLHHAVFELTSLRYLNLGGNNFNESELPSSGFQHLTKLKNLNLSNSNLGGQVPHDIGRLTNLVSLDLSSRIELYEIPGVGYQISGDFDTPLWVQNFTALVANLANLRELRLGSVDLSQSAEWCDALAKYTPNIRVLSMPFCSINRPVCGSLSALHSLSVIDLQHSRLSGPFPNFFANLSNLSVLQLRYNHLEGWVSPAIFEHKKLMTIDLHCNYKIAGILPNFPSNSRLQNLLVGSTNFFGTIPSSISNLTSLKQLCLDAPGFSGNLPLSIGELKSLKVLSISGLDLVGPIPSWITNLTSLEIILFSHCGLYGSIPSSIGHLNKLRTLAVMQCKASGEIPPHISNLTQLQGIVLSSNKFTGTVDLNSLWRLPNLEHLDLSNNKIVVIEGHDNSSMVSFPNIIYLKLASCSITKFPSILGHLDEISELDLSNNQIGGAIPHWAWEKWTDSDLFYLNFSHNKFTSIGYHTFLPFFIQELDLSFNMFEGPIPLPKNSADMLDYSGNMFSSISPNIGTQLQKTSVFKASRNNLSGSIPTSFCNRYMELLDLSYNLFSGSIPSCLMEGCVLHTIDFSSNYIEGKLPRSLSNCQDLGLLDVSNNQIADSFPSWLGVLPHLRVLVLRSNQFFGTVTDLQESDRNMTHFSSLQILDLSSNNFYGNLSQVWFNELKSMMVNGNDQGQVIGHETNSWEGFYRDTVTVTFKGTDLIFTKILSTFRVIDLSNNSFSGPIPASIGRLVSLHGLNMSHNNFTGRIPSRLGNLSLLESMDLSWNQLSGEIPPEFTSLTSLAWLNLSYNNLTGPIPQGNQFLSFPNSSFEGNAGLCGSQVSKQCDNDPSSTTTPASDHPEFNSLWQDRFDAILLLTFAGLGFGVGFALSIIFQHFYRIDGWTCKRR